MKMIIRKSTILLTACLLLLTILALPAMGWPKCPPCNYWFGECIYYCEPDWCEHCVGGECKSRCNPNLCEHCVDGSCQVCGGDPNQVCCDAWCCYKVWTKETTTAFDQSCPACSNYYWGCVGSSRIQPSYEYCLNVGVGQGEHCECHESYQTVGYIYSCKANWDVAKLLWCAAQGAWCVVECAVSGFDPSTCANCLAGIDCGGGFMEICDFVESCDPYDPSEVHDRVFTGFDC